MKILKDTLFFLALSFFLCSSMMNAFAREIEDDIGNNESGLDDTDFGLSEFANRSEGRIERELRNRRKLTVDNAYELGKSVYYGQKDGVPKLSYCVSIENDKMQLKRKTIKTYKDSSFSKLASSLYNCDAPEKQIIADLQRDEFLHVLYYLDKRYKLNLKRE